MKFNFERMKQWIIGGLVMLWGAMFIITCVTLFSSFMVFFDTIYEKYFDLYGISSSAVCLIGGIPLYLFLSFIFIGSFCVVYGYKHFIQK
jgi:hypothetical protein